MLMFVFFYKPEAMWQEFWNDQNVTVFILFTGWSCMVWCLPAAPLPILSGVCLLNHDGLLSTWLHLHAAGLSCKTTLDHEYFLKTQSLTFWKKLNCDSVEGWGRLRNFHCLKLHLCYKALENSYFLNQSLVPFGGIKSSLKYHFRRHKHSGNIIIIR